MYYEYLLFHMYLLLLHMMVTYYYHSRFFKAGSRPCEQPGRPSAKSPSERRRGAVPGTRPGP